MTTGIRSKGVDLDSIFAPYVQGTSPAATGIKFGGVDINTRYAPLIYGTAAAATGITCRPGGSGSLVDLNTLFAAIGTTSYSLAFNGKTYTALYVIPIQSNGYARIGFEIVNGNAWQVYKVLNGVGPTTIASGSIPANAATVQYAFGTYTVGVGFTDAQGFTSNAAPTPTSVATNPAAYYETATNTSTSGSKEREYPFTVDFFDAGATNISHNVCTLIGQTEGSV